MLDKAEERNSDDGEDEALRSVSKGLDSCTGHMATLRRKIKPGVLSLDQGADHQRWDAGLAHQIRHVVSDHTSNQQNESLVNSRVRDIAELLQKVWDSKASDQANHYW